MNDRISANEFRDSLNRYLTDIKADPRLAQRITGLPMYKRARLGIAYLPQEPSVFRKFTVEENILTAGFSRLEGDVILTYEAVVKKPGELTNTASLTAGSFPDGPIEAQATVNAREKGETPIGPDTPAKITGGSPKTGDTSHILLAAALMLIAAEAAFALYKIRKNRETEEE